MCLQGDAAVNRSGRVPARKRYSKFGALRDSFARALEDEANQPILAADVALGLPRRALRRGVRGGDARPGDPDGDRLRGRLEHRLERARVNAVRELIAAVGPNGDGESSRVLGLPGPSEARALLAELDQRLWRTQARAYPELLSSIADGHEFGTISEV